MGNLEKIMEMRKLGRDDEAIMNTLTSQGVSQEEVSDLLSKANIKSAVGETEDIKAPRDLNQLSNKKETMAEEYEGMQPSMLSEQTPATAPQEYSPQPYPAQAPAEQYQDYGQQSQQYSPQEYSQYSSGVSADTISEISEQVVSEKLSALKDQLEKTLDFKNSAESKLEALDERIKRIEKIIDRLQLSVLQKVGDYITNVEDIKQELVETQKTFKALLPQSNFQSRSSREPIEQKREFSREQSKEEENPHKTKAVSK